MNRRLIGRALEKVAAWGFFTAFILDLAAYFRGEPFPTMAGLAALSFSVAMICASAMSILRGAPQR